jgi:hypothetical protein
MALTHDANIIPVLHLRLLSEHHYPCVIGFVSISLDGFEGSLHLEAGRHSLVTAGVELLGCLGLQYYSSVG